MEQGNNENVGDKPEFSTGDGTDLGGGEFILFVKSGREIHKKKKAKEVVDIDELHSPVTNHPSSFLQWCSTVKDHVSWFRPKPKRDAFIASFFDFTDQNEK